MMSVIIGIMKNVISFFCLLALTGCGSLVGSGGAYGSRLSGADMNSINADMFQLKSRVQELEESNKYLRAEMNSVQSVSDAKLRAVEESLGSIKQDLARASAGNDKMKAEIVSEISKKIADLMRQTGSQRGSGDVGRYHVVASGDTLSAIATAYGKSADAIVKANNLKDVNSIRVGQKLFIPE